MKKEGGRRDKEKSPGGWEINCDIKPKKFKRCRWCETLHNGTETLRGVNSPRLIRLLLLGNHSIYSFMSIDRITMKLRNCYMEKKESSK